MGIFDFIGNVLSGGSNKKAIQRSADATNAALQKGIDQITGQQNANTQAYSPYTTAGGSATKSLADLLGLNGSDTESQALQQIKSNPLYTSQYDTGVDTILQNASATGGLRSGDTNDALAQFGSGLYGSTYQSLVNNLFGLSGQGLNATNAQVGTNSQLSDSIAQALGLQGQTQASAILGKQQVNNKTLNSLTGLLGSAPDNSATTGSNIYKALAGLF